tara:strand:- start:250 stop:477 length:228 start_codon:yes stop_codon:yes gene_type:complete
MEEKTNARQERIINYPDSVRQSISDWELEHRECLGQALEKGIKNIIEADEFLRDHMDHVDYGYLKELWDKRNEEL